MIANIEVIIVLVPPHFVSLNCRVIAELVHTIKKYIYIYLLTFYTDNSLHRNPSSNAFRAIAYAIELPYIYLYVCVCLLHMDFKSLHTQYAMHIFIFNRFQFFYFCIRISFLCVYIMLRIHGNQVTSRTKISRKYKTSGLLGCALIMRLCMVVRSVFAGPYIDSDKAALVGQTNSQGNFRTHDPDRPRRKFIMYV